MFHEDQNQQSVMARVYQSSSIFLVCFLLRLLPQTVVHAVEFRTVKQVVDGDTIVLENGERVRLMGIDAPEIKHATKAGAEMGKEAAAFARKLVEGKRVRLEFDPTHASGSHKDNRKRTLAYVFLADDTFLNAELLKQGYAFTIPGYLHKYREEFRRLEQDAKESRRGLWSKIQ